MFITIVRVVALVFLAGFGGSSAVGVADDATFDANDEARYSALMRLVSGTPGTPGDLQRFWSEKSPEFLSTETYRAPASITPYQPGDVPSTACTTVDDQERLRKNAYYCYPDSTIIYDDVWFKSYFAVAGEVAPVAILAHEWGHHLQDIYGRPELSIQTELQADCYAGVYLSDISSRLELGATTVTEAVLTFFLLGDDAFADSAWLDPGVHGPPDARVQAFEAGMLSNDLAYCRDYAGYSLLPELTMGAFSLQRPPGTTMRVGDPDADGTFQLTDPRGTTAQLRWLTTSRPDTAASLYDEAVGLWFGASTWQPIDTRMDDPFGDVIPGTGLLQLYAQTLEEEGRPPRQVHGAFTLLAHPGGGILVVDVFREGTFAEDPRGWEPVQAFLYILATGLCTDGATNAVCLA